MKNYKKYLAPALIGIMLLVLVGGQSVLKAQSPESVTVNNYAEGGIILQISSALQNLGDKVLGAAGTRFPNGISADTTSPVPGEVRGSTSTITGTTTLQEITLGSRYTSALTFTAGVTTTPGGLVSIQNTTATKLCSYVELDLKDSTGGGPTATGVALSFAISTSTTATAWSGSGTGLIASTTLTTTTAASIFNSRDNEGSGVAADTWIWTTGVYILGAFDDKTKGTGGTEAATSSNVYTGMSGDVYVDCHTR